MILVYGILAGFTMGVIYCQWKYKQEQGRAERAYTQMYAFRKRWQESEERRINELMEYRDEKQRLEKENRIWADFLKGKTLCDLSKLLNEKRKLNG